MAKNGMKRSVYFKADPTFNAVLARWKKEEQRAKVEKRAMAPFRVMGIVRMLIKRAGYRLISDIEIVDSNTGAKYKSITENKEGKE